MIAPRTFWLSSAAVLLAIVSAVTMKSFQGSRGSAVTGAVSATYVRGVLRTVIPYSAPRAGAGSLTLDVLNPEDEVLARSERRAEVPAGTGLWRDELRLAKPLATDE